MLLCIPFVNVSEGTEPLTDSGEAPWGVVVILAICQPTASQRNQLDLKLGEQGPLGCGRDTR